MTRKDWGLSVKFNRRTPAVAGNRLSTPRAPVDYFAQEQALRPQIVGRAERSGSHRRLRSLSPDMTRRFRPYADGHIAALMPIAGYCCEGFAFVQISPIKTRASFSSLSVSKLRSSKTFSTNLGPCDPILRQKPSISPTGTIQSPCLLHNLLKASKCLIGSPAGSAVRPLLFIALQGDTVLKTSLIARSFSSGNAAVPEIPAR